MIDRLLQCVDMILSHWKLLMALIFSFGFGHFAKDGIQYIKGDKTDSSELVCPEIIIPEVTCPSCPDVKVNCPSISLEDHKKELHGG